MGSNSFTVVVPLDYAFASSRKKLSPASVFTLASAIDFINRTPEVDLLVCGNTEHPKQGMHATKAIELRKEILSVLLETSCPRVFTSATNSIDEAENIQKELGNEKVIPGEIHIFCDRFHAVRARLIWGYFFPSTSIVIHKVNCPWGSEQAQFVQRSTTLWAVANYVATLVMKVRGVESIRNIKQAS